MKITLKKTYFVGFYTTIHIILSIIFTSCCSKNKQDLGKKSFRLSKENEIQMLQEMSKNKNRDVKMQFNIRHSSVCDLSKYKLAIYFGKLVYFGKFDSKILVQTDDYQDMIKIIDHLDITVWLIDETNKDGYIWTNKNNYSFFNGLNFYLVLNKNHDSYGSNLTVYQYGL